MPKAKGNVRPIRPRRHVTTWRYKGMAGRAKTIQEMITYTQSAVDMLTKMAAKGVVLEDDGGAADDYFTLVTTDDKVAEEFDMHDEANSS